MTLTFDDLPRLMDDLRDIAQRLLHREAPGISMRITELVNEAIVRQKPGSYSEPRFDEQNVTWETREHFFGHVHRAMRQILIEHGRARKKRNSRNISLDFVELRARMCTAPDETADLQEAITLLEEAHPAWARAVDYVFFQRLSQVEVANLMDVSERTVGRWLARARVWLAEALNKDRD